MIVFSCSYRWKLKPRNSRTQEITLFLCLMTQIFQLLQKHPHHGICLFKILVYCSCYVFIWCWIVGDKTYYCNWGNLYRIFADVEVGRPAQVPVRSKPSLSNGGKLVHSSHDGRKQGSSACHLPPKSGSSYKLNSTSKPSTAAAGSRKHLGNNSGNGPGRPVGPKSLPPKRHVSTTGNKSSTLGTKNPVNGVQKSVPSKVHSSISNHSMDQRKDMREPNKPKMVPKEPNKPKMVPKQPVASSKPQV